MAVIKYEKMIKQDFYFSIEDKREPDLIIFVNENYYLVKLKNLVKTGRLLAGINRLINKKGMRKAEQKECFDVQINKYATNYVRKEYGKLYGDETPTDKNNKKNYTYKDNGVDFDVHF